MVMDAQAVEVEERRGGSEKLITNYELLVRILKYKNI